MQSELFLGELNSLMGFGEGSVGFLSLKRNKMFVCFLFEEKNLWMEKGGGGTMSEALGIRSLIHSNVCVVNLRFRSCSVRFIYSFPCLWGLSMCKTT